jgi:hypothetical protein
MSRPTDHASLDLWQLHEDVAFGRAGGKMIWQPRILAWFTDRRFEGRPLPAPYAGMSEVDVYRSLGCSNRLYDDYNPCFKWIDPKGVARKDVEIDTDHICKVIETPKGTLTEIVRKTPNSWYLIEEKWWISTPEDMRVFTWLLDHAEWQWDQAQFEFAKAKWGRMGAPTMFMPRVTVQDLYINTMGVEPAIYALYEWGDVVDDYFTALNANHMRLVDVINASPVNIINFGDNLHCETLSPRLFEEHVLPAYHARTSALHAGGKWVCSHWDGKVKALLPFAKVCGLDGIEAITPLPQGDVTLEETKEALGDEVFLIDGIPAIDFDKEFGEDELIACAEKVIKLFAPKLILGISDEMSSRGEIERIRLVGKVVDDYNASLRSALTPTLSPRERESGEAT